MTQRSSFLVALVIAALIGVGVGSAQLALRNDGIGFPDGTVQTSAAETPGEFVQASGAVNIPEFDECGIGTVYTVPAGKRLRIEWLTRAPSRRPVEIAPALFLLVA